jgi:pimeloyl-ACP methyl ester carboxylesterase
MARRAMRDVIVLLPGITGSVLQKDGKDIWAFSGGAIIRALLSLGGSIKDLALTDDPPDEDDLGDGVTADRVMPDIHLIPGFWKIDGYGKVSTAIEEAFDVRRGENFFEFPYDWRRDNRAAARKLARDTHDWLGAWRERSGNTDAKLILVGHSMGGIVSRYFVEVLDGWRDTRMLVTFGTPYRGSLNALGFLVNGMAKKLGFLTLVDLSAMLRSFTSVYQLLPIYPCYDGGQGLGRIAETAGIPNVDQEKARAALAFHREIETAVDAHLKDDAYLQERYAIHPVVGTFQPTSQSARLGAEGVEILREHDGQDQDGDGTVPLVSATPIELGNQPHAMYAAARHSSLQNMDEVLVQLTGLLQGLSVDLDTFRDLRTALRLDLEDAFLMDEPIPVRVLPEDPESVARLAASVMDAETGAEVAQGTLAPGDDGWFQAELAPLPAGAYRVTVSGVGPVKPVTDVFAVFDPALGP